MQNSLQRPSPTESATLFNVGTIKKENDGNMYIIKVASNGGYYTMNLLILIIEWKI